MGNPRLGSAFQILEDLGQIVNKDSGLLVLSKEGQALLESELKSVNTI
jgi:hypothetical protein